MKTILFNTGMRIEFNNDGDICEIVGRRNVRNRYIILYKSIKSNKQYSDTRNDLIELYNDGILKIIY